MTEIAKIADLLGQTLNQLQILERRVKRLEGVEGHHRRLDRGHAEREPEQGGDTDSATASPIGGQGTGELSALVRQWEKEAADGHAMADKIGLSLPQVTSGLRDLAAVCERHARELLAAFGDPRPQSVADGDESCPVCSCHLVEKYPDGLSECANCAARWDTGSRKERSASMEAREK